MNKVENFLFKPKLHRHFYGFLNLDYPFNPLNPSDRIITVFGANFFFVSLSPLGWRPTRTLNRYLPGTRRGCIKMNLSPFGPPFTPKGPCQGQTKGRRRIRCRLQKLISHIQLSLQSYTICYTTEKFWIVSMVRAMACCEIL